MADRQLVTEHLVELGRWPRREETWFFKGSSFNLEFSGPFPKRLLSEPDLVKLLLELGDFSVLPTMLSSALGPESPFY